MNTLKKITYQRAIQFFRAKKAVDLYSKITNNSYEFRDILGGSRIGVILTMALVGVNTQAFFKMNKKPSTSINNCIVLIFRN